MENEITYNHGFFFPPGLRVFGISIILFSIALLYSFGPITLLLIICPLLILIGLSFFATKSLQIDKEQSKLIFINSWFGLKQKSSKSLDEFSSISILGQQYGVTSGTFLRGVNISFKDSFQAYNLILLNKNHLKKQLISSYDNYEDALTEAKKLSSFLDYEIVKFSPVNTRSKRSK